MKSFDPHSHHSLVTAILPRQSAARVLDEVLNSGAAHAMTLNARGTLVHDHWYQALLPAISPEQEILHFIVPDSDVDHLMEQIVMVGKLRLFGAGSIYAIPCEDLICSDDYPLWTPGQYRFKSVSFDIRFRRDLTALIHITDRGSAEPIARAAIEAGAQGATITYIRGYGLRDRLGLLRITKHHDKELITVVIEPYDLDAVFQAMARTGRVDKPGRGLIYQLPISKGLTNLASVFQAKKHSASIQQMVRAIDELHGSIDWRANQLLVYDPRAAEFAMSSRGLSRNLKLFNIVSQWKDTELLLNLLLDHGVSGASVSNWRFDEPDSEQTHGGLRMNREFGCISLILPPHHIPDLRRVVHENALENDMHEICSFSHSVPISKAFVSMTKG